MTAVPTRLLLLEDNVDDALLVQLALADQAPGAFSITAVERLADALARIRTERFDAVLCDLGLPDSTGLGTVQAITAAAPALPLVVFTGSHNDDLGRSAIEFGAQDYLVKGDSGAPTIARTLRYAIERKRLENALHEANRALEHRVAERTAELEMANKSLQEGEARYRQLFEANPHPMWFFDPETLAFLAVNDAAVTQYGWSRMEFLAMTLADIRPPETIPDLRERLAADNEKILRIIASSKHRKKDGTLIDVEIKSHIVDFGGRRARIVSAYDITDRKRAEEGLARESRRNQIFLRNASDGVHILDADGNVLEVSDSFCEMLGYSREELLGANVSLWDAQWSPQELKLRVAEQIAKKDRSVLETRHRRRDGSILDVEITGQSLELEGSPVLFNSARDITGRKHAAEALRAAEEQFHGLVEQSIAGIYIIQDERFAYVNRRFAEIRGFGSADELIGRDPLPLVAEKDRGTAAENNRRLLAGEIPSITYDFTALCKDSSTVEVGVSSTGATYRGRPAIIGMMQDISEKKRAEKRIQRYIEQLKTAVMSTVEVATTLSEMRDPYTAGHERRVAEIAAAIGAELGFDDQRIEGLRVAGHLHDVGKIAIPSEILAKPGKLSPLEFQLIQGHPRASFEVLKDVEFPWPVAQIALQHHERMDGSGYPQGLKGDAILLDARILSVADVVEAMSSHRPYRAGLGVDTALAEIVRGRGTAYDPVVTDACLKLFREDGYAIPA